MKIQISPRFEKRYKKLANRIRRQAKEKEAIFRTNPFDRELKTHKLRGKEKQTWAFWVNYSYRIKFIFLSGEEVLFLDIGKHGEVY